MKFFEYIHSLHTKNIAVIGAGVVIADGETVAKGAMLEG